MAPGCSPDEDKLSFDIIDYSGATALFSDSDFDGPPELVVEEEIDDLGDTVTDTVVEQPEPVFDAGEEDGNIGHNGQLDPDNLDDEPTTKYYVDGTEVWVTAQAVYQPRPETHRLRLVEYRDFVTETVRALFLDAAQLRSRWATRVGRQDVLEALQAHGIGPVELLERSSLREADPLDVLVHLAWNQPLATRTDRVRRVHKEHADFFGTYQPAARQVLDYLLDKYAEHGIGELDDLGVLQVPPLASLDSPAEIAARFGSTDALKQAVIRLSELIYVA